MHDNTERYILIECNCNEKRTMTLHYITVNSKYRVPVVRNYISFVCIGYGAIVTHPRQQVRPENGHEYEDAEEAHASEEEQDVHPECPQPLAPKGVLRRRGIRGLHNLA